MVSWSCVRPPVSGEDERRLALPVTALRRGRPGVKAGKRRRQRRPKRALTPGWHRRHDRAGTVPDIGQGGASSHISRVAEAAAARTGTPTARRTGRSRHLDHGGIPQLRAYHANQRASGNPCNGATCHPVGPSVTGEPMIRSSDAPAACGQRPRPYRAAVSAPPP